MIASFEALTHEMLAVKDAPGLRKLHRKVDKLDLLEAGDEAAHRRVIDKCIKQLRAHRKKLPELAARELDNILDTVTDS